MSQPYGLCAHQAVHPTLYAEINALLAIFTVILGGENKNRIRLSGLILDRIHGSPANVGQLD